MRCSSCTFSRYPYLYATDARSAQYAYRYCSPSRGSFLSGRLPFHAHESNPGITVQGCLNLNYTLLPAKLAEAGYISHQVGKWHEGMDSKACIPIHRGFNSSYGYLSGAEDHVDQSVAYKLCGGPDGCRYTRHMMDPRCWPIR